MPENIAAILPELWVATAQTFLMLAIGLSAAVLIGGPLGVLLFLLGPGQSLDNKPAFLVLNWLVNTVRSFPFIILLVALVPFTRSIVGTSIGPLAAAVPLSFAAIRYGYYRFQTDVMVLTVALLVLLVQAVQFTGNTVARRLDKR